MLLLKLVVKYLYSNSLVSRFEYKHNNKFMHIETIKVRIIKHNTIASKSRNF